MDGYYIIRTYKAGSISEKIKFWVPGSRPTRSERRLRSEIAKIKQNGTSAERRIARDLNENFHRGEKGMLIGLDYHNELGGNGYLDTIMDSVKKLEKK